MMAAFYAAVILKKNHHVASVATKAFHSLSINLLIKFQLIPTSRDIPIQPCLTIETNLSADGLRRRQKTKTALCPRALFAGSGIHHLRCDRNAPQIEIPVRAPLNTVEIQEPFFLWPSSRRPKMSRIAETVPASFAASEVMEPIA
jgi:hypothetical protein